MDTKNGLFYDLVVIGGGHAGCEAALAAARMGRKTLLLTLNLDMTAYMACNPSLGGPGKGHLVKEIDALGGEMPRVADEALLQVRMLNTGKGPAVQAIRAQVDKWAYQRKMRLALEKEDNLTLREDMAEEILVENGTVRGVTARSGATYRCQALVLCSGVYLGAEIFLGTHHFQAAPGSITPPQRLTASLKEHGIRFDRLKTGTPPRVYRRSVDFSRLAAVPGDPGLTGFSAATTAPPPVQMPCYLTYTNTETHGVIRDNIALAPVYSGLIKGRGPRYCPSIEDKITRFADRDRHPVFIEPESADSEELYLQGISTGLPPEIQEEFLRTIPGLEKVEITRYAYAIEYDYSPPTGLKSSLETRAVKGLFFAGQVNGTTGYEEAAAQGLIAGVNAALYLDCKPALILKRNEAYSGVMVDDLVTKGVHEPYRIFTSRAEFRLLLRQDNADLRLSEKGFALGLLDRVRYEHYLAKRDYVDAELDRLARVRHNPGSQIDSCLDSTGSPSLQQPVTAVELIRRPEISLLAYYKWEGRQIPELPPGTLSELENRIKYAGYIDKQQQMVDKAARLYSRAIPADFPYQKAVNLSREARQKLDEIRPENVGQAARLEGVSPADISVMLLYLDKPEIFSADRPGRDKKAENGSHNE